jgi:hypothetical protein
METQLAIIDRLNRRILELQEALRVSAEMRAEVLEAATNEKVRQLEARVLQLERELASYKLIFQG